MIEGAVINPEYEWTTRSLQALKQNLKEKTPKLKIEHERK